MEIRWMYAFIDRPAAVFPAAREFWTAATGTHLSPYRGDFDQFATLLPDAGGDANLKIQALAAEDDVAGTHLDFAFEDVSAATRKALDLGSELTHEEPGFSVLRSPGGLNYCLVTWKNERERMPVCQNPTGSRTRMDQVSIDITPDQFDREVAFWQALTGWDLHQGRMPEFQALIPPTTMLPLRILIQRLDSPSSACVTAHPDFACSDIDATATWHESLGARKVTRYPHWQVMQDPAGGTYCLTGRLPETGMLP